MSHEGLIRTQGGPAEGLGCVPNSVLSLVPAPKLAVVGLLWAGCSYLDPVIAPHWVPRSDFLYNIVPNYIQNYVPNCTTGATALIANHRGRQKGTQGKQ